MDWITIIGLILIGTFLVVAEILFIPGIFIAGTIGVLLSIWGIYIGYEAYGATTGTFILLAAIISNVTAVALTLRGKTWEKFSLRQSHIAKVNEDFKIELKIGVRGKTISTLKPIGKALFGENVIEVRSKGNYISENVEIEIERIDSSKIFVKTVK